MDTVFPYEQIRPQQDALHEQMQRILETGKCLVAHAPTGLGKTAATMAPALSHGLANGKVTFFVTPRHSQHAVAVETLRDIKDRHGTDFVAADLVGKQHLCDGGRYRSSETDCPRHAETYTEDNQLTGAAWNQVKQCKAEPLLAEEVKANCVDVCPYAVLKQVAAEADVVIADYFHVFHPGVRQALFGKAELTLPDATIIVDEAHNIPSRTRDLYSATLSMKRLGRARQEAEKHGLHEASELVDGVSDALHELAAEHLGMEAETVVGKEDFLQYLSTVADVDDVMDVFGTAGKTVLEESEKQESACEAVAEFVERWQGGDQGFVRVLSKVQPTHGDPYIKLSYTCLNPMHATQEVFTNCHAAAAMSGTLTPTEMYADLFGMPPAATVEEVYTSPFPEENKLELIVDTVTTKYTERDTSMYQKIAWYLLQSMEHVPGNMGVFFPSYAVQKKVFEQMQGRTDRTVFREKPGMEKAEKQALFDRFAGATETGGLLLGVVGGSFGEGVDYPGELMQAACVVGVPLQPPDLETEALIEFYDEKFGNGWEYAYNVPAVNRALQAAGRCIRSASDKGVVMFLDERYTWDTYAKALPSTNYQVTQAPWQQIEAFFQRNSAPV